MVTALAELDTNEEFWPGVVARISEGEFISTIALELKVNYSILRNWIRGNKTREEQFSQAEIDGKKVRQQTALKKVYEAATAKIEADPTRMEQLRAAEIFLKQEDEIKAPPSRIGNLTINFVAAKDGKEVKGEVIDQLP